MLGVNVSLSGLEFVDIDKEKFIADHQLTFSGMPQFLVTQEELGAIYDTLNTVTTLTPIVWCNNVPLTRIIKAITVPLNRDSEDVLLSISEVCNKLSSSNILFLFHGKNFAGSAVFSTLSVERSVLDRQLKLYNLLKDELNG